MLKCLAEVWDAAAAAAVILMKGTEVSHNVQNVVFSYNSLMYKKVNFEERSFAKKNKQSCEWNVVNGQRTK